MEISLTTTESNLLTAIAAKRSSTISEILKTESIKGVIANELIQFVSAQVQAGTYSDTIITDYVAKYTPTTTSSTSTSTSST